MMASPAFIFWAKSITS